MARNILRAAVRGREPGMRLVRGSQEVGLFEWGGQVLAECAPIAAALDAALYAGTGGSGYSDALAAAVAALNDPASTPSARVLEAIQQSHDGSYSQFVLAQSLQHRTTIRSLALGADVAERFSRLAEVSLAEQRRIEASDTVPFETFRQQYLDIVKLASK